MYDEPFAGLDPISLGTAAQLIRQLNDALGITSIVVSHDLEETFRIADQVIILANGRIAAQGTPEEVRAVAATRWCTSSSMRSPTARCASTTRALRWPRISARGWLRADELVAAPPTSALPRARKLADLGYGARLLLRACWRLLGAALRALRPGARPDPFPGQLLAGHHHGVGPVRRLRAGAAGLLHAAALWLLRGAGPAGGPEPGARTGPGGHGAAVRRPRRHLAHRRNRPDEGRRAAVAPWK